MNKRPKRSRAEVTARSVMKSVPLHNPCLVLIKHGTAVANQQVIEHLVHHMDAAGVAGVLAVVDDFNDLTSLNKNEMRELGWKFVGQRQYDYDEFLQWMSDKYPDVELQNWQSEFARAYLNKNAEMLLAARPAASGKTFISDLLSEFRES